MTGTHTIAATLGAMAVALAAGDVNAGPTEEVHHGFAPVNGTRLFYEVRGTGPAVVLIHGGQLDCRMWGDQFDAFSRRYRVIRYDVRGYGGSPRPDVPYSDAEDLAALLDYLENQSVLGFLHDREPRPATPPRPAAGGAGPVTSRGPAAPAAVLHVAELTTGQIRDLDRAKTVVLLQGGILEEHGPYLPAHTDGILSECLTQTPISWRKTRCTRDGSRRPLITRTASRRSNRRGSARTRDRCDARARLSGEKTSVSTTGLRGIRPRGGTSTHPLFIGGVPNI